MLRNLGSFLRVEDNVFIISRTLLLSGLIGSSTISCVYFYTVGDVVFIIPLTLLLSGTRRYQRTFVHL